MVALNSHLFVSSPTICSTLADSNMSAAIQAISSASRLRSGGNQSAAIGVSGEKASKEVRRAHRIKPGMDADEVRSVLPEVIPTVRKFVAQMNNLSP